MKPTKHQQQAIDDRGESICVDAGAGSGKTTVLVARIVSILEKREADLDEIVAITFTELAAREMKSRLREAFAERASECNTNGDDAAFWRRLERRADTARVSTIHGFCASILREHALRIGIDPDFTQLDESEAFLVRERCVVDTVHQLLAQHDTAALRIATAIGAPNLRKAIHEAIQAEDTIASIVSTANYTDAQSVVNDVNARRKELQDLIFRTLCRSGKASRLLHLLHTFDGQCENPEDGRELKRFAMIDALECMIREDDVAEIRERLSGYYAIKKSAKSENWIGGLDAITKAQKAVHDFFKGLDPPEPDPETEREAAELISVFYKVYTKTNNAYEKAKTDRNALDFDDLIRRAGGVLREGVRGSNSIRHLLMDEFQDTDSRQYEIAQSIIAAHGDTSTTLFIVGDAKQAIYGWRGAEVEVFRQAREDTRREAIPLKDNFRSVPGVIDFCNDFFETSQALRAVESPYGGLNADREDLPGPRVEFLIADMPEDGGVRDGRAEEADLLCRRVFEWCDPKTGVKVGKEGRTARIGDIAWLMRSRSDLAVYEQALRRYNIDYRVESGPGYYTRQEVRDVRNVLAVIADPWDEPALLAFVRSPIVGMTDSDIFRLSPGGGLAERFNSDVMPPDLINVNRLTRARNIVRNLKEHRDDPLPIFVRRVITETGIESVYLAQSYLARQRAANVRKIIGLADGFARTPSPTLAAFNRYLDEVTIHEIREGEAPLPDEEGGALRIMTVHQSKGLEFPIVAIIDAARCIDSNRSHSPLYLRRGIGMAIRPPDDLGEAQHGLVDTAIGAVNNVASEEENNRTLYVAMTRAKDYLAISAAADAKNTDASWFGAFMRAYEIDAYSDGDTLNAGAAEVLVRRDAKKKRSKAKTAKPITLPGRNAIEPLIAPATSTRFGIFRMSTTDVAQAIAHMRAPAAPHAGSTATTGAKRAMARGTMVHEVLERWTTDSDIAVIIEEVVKQHIWLPARRDELATEIRAICDRIAIHPIIQRIHTDEFAEREAPFSIVFPEGVIDGAVDVALGDGAIIDYKTGPIPGGLNQYQAQVQLYAYARHTLCNQTPTEGVLFFVETGETVNIDVTADAIGTIAQDARAVLRDCAMDQSA